MKVSVTSRAERKVKDERVQKFARKFHKKTRNINDVNVNSPLNVNG